MFGLLRVKSCGLSEQDKDSYKATFCSACHALHRFEGRMASLATNYDITLWLALGQALDPVERPMVKAPCTALPLNRVQVYELEPRLAGSAAALNLALIAAKLKDNADDGSSLWAAADRAFTGKRAKAHQYLERQGFPVTVLSELPLLQAQREAERQPTLDSLSEPTAGLMGECFAFLGQLVGSEADSLRRFGEELGRFVYLWDAACDRKKDEKRGEFNALVATQTDSGAARSRLLEHLGQLEELLKDLPLRRGHAIFRRLLKNLYSEVHQRYPRPAASLPRPNLAEAAFLKTQDCGCCECGCKGCCHLDCCFCEGDGCPGCCDLKCCNPCDCGNLCCCCK